MGDPYAHSRHVRLRYSVIAPIPSELCLADGAAGRSNGRAVELPISVRGPRPSWIVGRCRPRLCARSSWRHQTLACGCRSWPYPVIFGDGRQRANRGDRSAKDGELGRLSAAPFKIEPLAEARY
jgi:hypothetical protein